MIQYGIAKKDFICNDCGARLHYARDLQIFYHAGELCVKCPNCGYWMQIRINVNSKIELIDSRYYGQGYYQDENGIVYVKDAEGNFKKTENPNKCNQ